jgi:aspartate/methionine/tyrosine aminotransferase
MENTIKESTIRKMTRLAAEYDAVNLSQGFPNEGPPRKVRMALAHGVLTGQTSDEWETEDDLEEALLKIFQKNKGDDATTNGFDQLNQYSPPMGRLDVRQAISDYYQRFYEYQVSPDDITVTLGATEAFASALRTIGRPNDKCVIFEPFHELYPSQCSIFYLDPLYVTLQRDTEGIWKYSLEELETALRQAKLLMLNSPHNPTGKVFSYNELAEIVRLCQKYDCYIITDEIYEHMTFGDTPHYLLPKEFPGYADRILVCNS